MKQEKKLHYVQNMYAGIHTISGVSSQEIAHIDPLVVEAVKCNVRKVKNSDKKETYMRINPNKLANEDKSLIANYNEFKEYLDLTLDCCGLDPKEFKINRADMSFNSNNPQDYLLYRKLHRLLICCIADAYKFVNCYQTYDLWNYDSLNVAIKNDDYECENYNKDKESQGKDVVKNRLEIRSKRIKNSDMKYEFLCIWSEKLDNAICHFESVQERYNKNLAQLYLEDLKKPKNERKYYNHTSFCMQFSDCIFTSRQMVDLLNRMGIDNPQTKAKTFKRNHKIEYFSKADLQFIVNVIKKKTEEYFGESKGA